MLVRLRVRTMPEAGPRLRGEEPLGPMQGCSLYVCEDYLSHCLSLPSLIQTWSHLKTQKVNTPQVQILIWTHDLASLGLSFPSSQGWGLNEAPREPDTPTG